MLIKSLKMDIFRVFLIVTDTSSLEKLMDRTLTNTLEYKSLITFRSYHSRGLKDTPCLKLSMT